MFYAHIVLAKKGPLARIWLAAHWDKKLTKAHVFETNIEQSVDGIMQPKVKLALRTSGHLLLGVVRIYSRKAKYLLADCNEAFVKIKMAFRPGMVDLPEEHREAAVNAITLPEVFHDFDTALPELNEVDIEAQFSINQSRADEITMREDYGNLPMTIHDDGFGDIGFDADGPDFIRDDVDTNIDENLISDELDLEDRSLKEPVAGTSRSMQDIDSQQLITDDGFGGGGFGQEPAAGLFEGDLFADAPLPQSSMPMNDNDSDDDMGAGWDDMGAHSTASSSAGSRAPSPTLAGGPSQMNDVRAPSVTSPTQQLDDLGAPHGAEGAEASIDDGLPGAVPDTAEGGLEQDDEHEAHDEESFALAPIDASALKGVTKTKRKRKLIVDEVKNISGEEMKSQLANTADIITTLDLAPPTKRLMYWKETGGVEKLFALPSRDLRTKELSKNYQRFLTSRSMNIEDFSVLGPADALALDQYQEQPQVILQQPEPAVPGKRGRKRKVPEAPQSVPDVPQTPQAVEEEQPLDILQPPQTPHLSSPVHDTASHLEGDFPLAYTSNNMSEPVMTPMHDGMTPDYTGGLTPFDHEMMTPQHPSIDQIESIPNLPPDQVSSILNGAEIGFENMGYDDSHQIGGAGMSERIASDWNDDYDFPPSVVAAQPGDEQMENETDEQFEERVLNKRAAQMFVSVRARLQKQDSIQLSDMTYRNNRKQAAQKFYSLLVLKKFQALEIRQDMAYGDITVTKGIMFDNPKL